MRVEGGVGVFSDQLHDTAPQILLLTCFTKLVQTVPMANAHPPPPPPTLHQC